MYSYRCELMSLITNGYRTKSNAIHYTTKCVSKSVILNLGKTI